MVKRAFLANGAVTAGRIKLVLVLAGLVLGGGLLCATGRIKAETGQEQAASTELEKTDANHPALTGNTDVPRIESEFFYKMLLSVIIVIVLGIAVIYLSRKVLPRLTSLPGKQIRVMETTHLAPRKGLHLVQVGARRLLIASTNENITMLADVTETATDFAAELASRTKEEK